MNSINIEGNIRSTIGKKSSSDDRKLGLIPCNLFGIKENISFTVNAKAARALIYTPDFHTANLSLNGNTYQAIIKETQFDPLSDEVIHIDFLATEPGKVLTVTLPVRLKGTPKGVRDGGKLTHKLKKMNVKTTPEKLVSAIEIGVEHLEMGNTLRVGDLKLDGIEIMHSSSIPVCDVFTPRVVKEDPVAAKVAAPAAAAPAAAAAKAPAAAAKPAAKK